MDFHTLSRRDLQTLCKKNQIPANLTNIAMADALQELQMVEGMEEIQEAMRFLSPKKVETRSPGLPRTSRRTSARRGSMLDAAKDHPVSTQTRARRVPSKASEIKKIVGEEGEKQESGEEMEDTSNACTGSPLPRSRRVTARASDIRGLALEGDAGEKQDDQIKIPKTPAIPPSGRKTRAPEGPVGIRKTPATIEGRRTSARLASKTQVIAETEDNEPSLRTYRRRQSTRKQQEEMIHTSEAASSRTTRRTAAVKMAALAQEEEKQEGGDAAGMVVPDDVSGEVQNALHSGEELTKDVEMPLDSVARTEGSDTLCNPTEDGKDRVQDQRNFAGVAYHRGIELVQEIPSDAPDGGVADKDFKEQQKDDDEEEERQKEEPESEGSEDSPIRGLVVSKRTDDVEVTPIEELKPSDGAPVGNPAVDGGRSDFDLPNPPLSSESPIGDGSNPQLDLEIAEIQLSLDTPVGADSICTAMESLGLVSEQGDANLGLQLSRETQVESKDSGDDLQLEQAPEAESSPPATPSPSLQISDGFGPAHNSPELDLVSEIKGSPLMESDEINHSTNQTALDGQDLPADADSSSLPAFSWPDPNGSAAGSMADNIDLPGNPTDSNGVLELEETKRGKEEKRAGTVEVGFVGLYREENKAGSGEAKVENKAEKCIHEMKDLKDLSLRKLKTLVKEKMAFNSTKVGEKRSGLATLDENLI